MTQAQAMRRRELIAKAAGFVRLANEAEYDEQGRLYDEATRCINQAKWITGRGLSDSELGLVRLAENSLGE